MDRESTSLFVITLTLVGLGVVMVYSSSGVFAEQTTYIGNDQFFFIRHIIFGAGGLLCLMMVSVIDYHRWQTGSILVLLLSLFLLIVVLCCDPINGAKRWIPVGPIKLQPSEFAKLGIVLYLASICARKQKDMNSLVRGYLPAMLVVALVSGLVLLEHDLGSPFVIGAVAISMLFVAGMKVVFLAGTIVLSLPALAFLILTDKERVSRILIFLDPWADPLGDGWQLCQSLIAFGSGGLSGVGLGLGRQKLFYLGSEAHTDFIFAILGEELGLVGTTAVVVLFFLFLFVGMRVAARAQDQFGSFLAAGMTMLVCFQGLVHMFVDTGLAPTKGTVLPFISYGGSALLVMMIAVGVLISVARASADTA